MIVDFQCAYKKLEEIEPKTGSEGTACVNQNTFNVAVWRDLEIAQKKGNYYVFQLSHATDGFIYYMGGFMNYGSYILSGNLTLVNIRKHKISEKCYIN